MIPTPEFKPEAAAEAEEAYWWYESRSPGLGAEFMLALDACLARVQRHPEGAMIAHEEFRRALFRRFPYSVFYIGDGSRITVYAVFHAKRDPQVLADRLP